MQPHHVAFVEFADAAGLAYVVVAMFAVLILGGLWLLTTFAGGLFRKVPLVGGPIANAFDAAARWIRGIMLKTLHGTLWAAGKIAYANWVFLRNMFGIVRNAADALGGALEHTVNVIIPREVKALRHNISLLRKQLLFEIDALNHSLRQRINQVANDLRADIGRLNKQLRKRIDQVDKALRKQVSDLNKSLRARIDQVDTALRNEIAQLNQALRDLIASRFNAAEDFTRSKFDQAEKDISQAKADAEHYADQVAAKEFHDAITTVNNEAATAARDTWPEVTAMIGTLEKTAGNDFQDVQRLLQQIPTNAPTDVTAALAAAIRFFPPMAQLAVDCTIPECRDLGPTRQWLHDMQLPLTSAALIAWFIEMVTEPQAWADQTYTVLEPLVNAEFDILSGFLGL
jgi:chorismate mutase